MFPLWAKNLGSLQDSLFMDKKGNFKVLADVDLHFFRKPSTYAMSFQGVRGPGEIALVCMWLDPRDVRACMQVSPAWYLALKESNALARARLQHLSYGFVDKAVRLRFNGAYGAAWKVLQSSRTYARLVAMRSAGSEDVFLLLDINLCLWRSIKVVCLPKVDEARKARQDFLKDHPGYMD